MAAWMRLDFMLCVHCLPCWLCIFLAKIRATYFDWRCEHHRYMFPFGCVSYLLIYKHKLAFVIICIDIAVKSPCHFRDWTSYVWRQEGNSSTITPSPHQPAHSSFSTTTFIFYRICYVQAFIQCYLLLLTRKLVGVLMIQWVLSFELLVLVKYWRTLYLLQVLFNIELSMMNIMRFIWK